MGRNFMPGMLRELSYAVNAVPSIQGAATV